MNASLASNLAFAGAVAAATMAAFLSGSARAETPTIDTTPFVSMKTRAEVRAELMSPEGRIAANSTEWSLQMADAPQGSGLTRSEVRAGYVAARDEVRALNAEDSGSAYIGHGGVHVAVRPGTVMASSGIR